MTTVDPARVTVVVPVHQQAALVGSVAELVATGWPVVVVDDGSRNDTAGVAHTAGA